VDTLGIGADADYNPIQIQEMINKVDELINALRSSGGKPRRDSAFVCRTVSKA
jgi:hypothetical protein